MSRSLLLIAICAVCAIAQTTRRLVPTTGAPASNCPPSPCPKGTVLARAKSPYGGNACPFDRLHLTTDDGTCCLSKCPVGFIPILDANFKPMTAVGGVCKKSPTSQNTADSNVFGEACCERVTPSTPQPGPAGPFFGR